MLKPGLWFGMTNLYSMKIFVLGKMDLYAENFLKKPVENFVCLKMMSLKVILKNCQTIKKRQSILSCETMVIKMLNG